MIYNIQLDLNNKQSQFSILDDLLDNSILLSIVCLLNKINVFSQEYFNCFYFSKSYELDFELLKIDPNLFKNVNDLRNEIMKSENTAIKNKLISYLTLELYSKMEIKNYDLQNVFSIILNLNTYIQQQFSKQTTSNNENFGVGDDNILFNWSFC